MRKREPWDFWVLGALRDGTPTHLQSIYSFIEELKGSGYINTLVFDIERISGAPPKYKHRVRSTINSLKNRHLVEHLGKGKTGRYRITDAGMSELSRIEP
jgi:DNA-binding PadR family transcriptional regulator